MYYFVAGIVVRQIADLLTMIHEYQTTPPSHYLEVGFQESINLQVIFNFET